MKWFRLYDELVDDLKVQQLPLEEFRALINLWCITCQNDGRLPAIEGIMFKLRLPAAKVRKLLAALQAAGLFDEEDGVLVPHNWKKRQFKTDAADPTNADRQERYRNRQRNGPSNGRHNGPKDRYGGVTSKRPESKTESETDSGESDQHPPETVAASARGQSLVSPEAFAIADEIAESVGFSKETWPPGWCGAPMAIEKWLKDGCPGEVVKLAVASALKRKRDGPPETFSYFAKPIAQAFADYQRPNPTAPPQAFEGKTNGHSTAKPTVIDAANNMLADIDARIAEAEAREAGRRASEAPSGLLPPQRRD